MTLGQELAIVLLVLCSVAFYLGYRYGRRKGAELLAAGLSDAMKNGEIIIYARKDVIVREGLPHVHQGSETIQ